MLRADDVVKIASILCGVRIREIRDFYIGMGGGTMALETKWSQEGWVVVGTSDFVATDERAKQPTTFPAMVANRAAQSRHPNRVCQGQEQEDH
jgi:hypothetical protein